MASSRRLTFPTRAALPSRPRSIRSTRKGKSWDIILIPSACSTAFSGSQSAEGREREGLTSTLESPFTLAFLIWSFNELMKTLLPTLATSFSTLLTLLTLSTGRTFAAGNPAIPIENIILIVQENHAFDNYFGTYPGANGIPAGTTLPTVPGGPLLLQPFLTTLASLPNDLDHLWLAAAVAYDNGLMDGFYWSAYDVSAAYYGKGIPIPQPDPNLVQIVSTSTPTSFFRENPEIGHRHLTCFAGHLPHL